MSRSIIILFEIVTKKLLEVWFISMGDHLANGFTKALP
jgi:hypothetical protein